MITGVTRKPSAQHERTVIRSRCRFGIELGYLQFPADAARAHDNRDAFRPHLVTIAAPVRFDDTLRTRAMVVHARIPRTTSQHA